jgi:hypothetical protein
VCIESSLLNVLKGENDLGNTGMYASHAHHIHNVLTSCNIELSACNVKQSACSIQLPPCNIQPSGHACSNNYMRHHVLWLHIRRL